MGREARPGRFVRGAFCVWRMEDQCAQAKMFSFAFQDVSSSIALLLIAMLGPASLISTCQRTDHIHHGEQQSLFLRMRRAGQTNPGER